MSEPSDRNKRTSDRPWFRIFIGALITLGLAQAGATWKLAIVAENDIKHLTIAVETIQKDIRDLFRTVYQFDE